MVKRRVRLPEEAEAIVSAFIDEVDHRLSSTEDTNDVVREVLVDLNGDRAAYDAWRNSGYRLVDGATPAPGVRSS